MRTETNGPAAPAHLPQIDGLRGLAIIGVLLNHCLAAPWTIYAGWGGVVLFFVLSGYLITRLLLRDRDRAAAEGLGRGAVLATFCWRRGLRIFPIYYLTILFLLHGLGDPSVRTCLKPLLTYTLNITGPSTGVFPSSASHTWSLCVEEQFYLVWPLVVLFCPRRLLGPAIATVVLVGPLSRLNLAMAGAARLKTYMYPQCRCDCLGLGGMLAYVEWRVGTKALMRTAFVRGCGLLGIVGAAAFVYCVAAVKPIVRPELLPAPGYEVASLFINSAFALAFAWLMARALTDGSGDLVNFLSMKWLRFVGRISYGLYLYHVVAIAWLIQAPTVGAHFAMRFFWVALPISFAAALVSWYGVERPLLRLKGVVTPERVQGWFVRRPPAAAPAPVPTEVRAAA